ncbi:G-protein-signaling modulator 3 [Eretmochelys imbricata]
MDVTPPTLTEAEPLDPFDRERLFDLLFRSQSRRLNEQRCPLPGLRGAPRHDPARPWRSLPGTPTEGLLGGAGKFYSLTSLQAEQFFELVATAQARRLDDQRADFTGDPGAEEGAEGAPRAPRPGGRSCTAPSSPTRASGWRSSAATPPSHWGPRSSSTCCCGCRGDAWRSSAQSPPLPCCPTPAEHPVGVTTPVCDLTSCL